MPITNPAEKLQRAQAFLQSQAIGNLHAQAHARAILRHLAQPSADWPRFRLDLDDRLHHAAHYLLWTALQLMEVGHPQEDVNPLLLAGSEALEFLSADPRYPSPVQIEQAVNATFGYYLSAHYARSYVLLREAIPDTAGLPPILSLLVAVLRKRFGEAREITISHFSQASLQDEAIAEGLAAGQLGEDEAYERVLLASATQAVSFFLEFPKTGETSLLETAISTLDDAILIAREKRYVDWWWWLFCLRFLFREFGNASPWNRLGPFRDGGTASVLVDEYIRAGLRNEPPIVELWPSQIQALPMIAEVSRRDFCLKMPTSSGKTRIAELTILRFLQDYSTDGSTKCIYLAPFRSLAVEVEQTLRRSLGMLGVTVSQLYGGFEITPADTVFLRRYRILIATPEKFDALLRFAPELGDDIRLVIIDEGHIVDPNERGLRFEFFVQRLLRRLRRDSCRFVFVSAVLPNAGQFAEWITGSPENLVESRWRPSRLMLGRLNWDGTRVRIDYTHRGRERFEQDCFVPRFIEQKNCRGVAGLGKRRNAFPHDANEAFALSALLYAQEGTTLVFVPQQKTAEPFARKLLDALAVQRCLREQDGANFVLPTPGRGSALWERCRTVIEAEMGSDSILLGLLQEGILLHHGGLPWRVRVAIEDLARADALRLIVATTTLAQGINLPIKSVLVRGLQFGHNRFVSPMTFWNICGRAGRAMKENEGQVLFCMDRTTSAAQQRRFEDHISRVLDTLEQARITSAMLLILQRISEEWARVHPTVSLSELCLYLVENRFDWAQEDTQESYRTMVDMLDGHLLAISEEFGIDPTNPDRLQEFLQGSLLFIQLRENAPPGLTPEIARDIFHARVRYIHRQHPDQQVRQRLYRLNMSLSSCETIEAERTALLALFLEAAAWFTWSLQERADLLLRIAQFIFRLQDTAPDRPLPPQWPSILSAWLAGRSTAEMVSDETIRQFTDSPSTLCLFVEKMCGYLLPWGLNSILTYLGMVAAELGGAVPPICSYLAGMVKYGVATPVAVCLVPYLDQDRRLAIEASAVCPHGFEHPEDVIHWILDVTADDLVALGMDRSVAEAIVQRRNWQRHTASPRTKRPSEEILLSVSEKIFIAVNSRDKLLVISTFDSEPGAFDVFTLQGDRIGSYEHPAGAVPYWWREVYLVDSEVIRKEHVSGNEYRLTINLLSV